MNETTKNFIEVFSNLEPWSLPVVLFRLYYDDQGRPIEYSHEDKPGNYIDISPEMFRDSPYNLRVINGEIKFIETSLVTKKLIPTTGPGVACSPQDICIVVSQEIDHVNWSLKIYEPH